MRPAEKEAGSDRDHPESEKKGVSNSLTFLIDVDITPYGCLGLVEVLVSYHSTCLARSFERGAGGDANRRNLPYRESQHGKAIMSSSCRAGRREKFWGKRKRGGRR